MDIKNEEGFMENNKKFYTFRGYEMLNQENKQLTPSMEDYLEMIYRNCFQEGYARIHQLSEQLNVRASSATKIVQKLARWGFLDYQKYGIIQLTDKGETAGAFLLYRHQVIEEFLKKIGVEEMVLKDTEMIEHHISKELFESMELFNMFFEKNPHIIESFFQFKQSYLDIECNVDDSL
jgi:Mn-dependent DtxR family transcriptional regulator